MQERLDAGVLEKNASAERMQSMDKVGRPAAKSIFISRSSCSLDKPMLLGLTNLVRANTRKTEISDISTNRIWINSGRISYMYY